MPTHQSLGGGTDADLLERMAATHSERFGEAFWSFFSAEVSPHLPSRPVILDVGCGPGLLLRDLGERHPGATLHGYDVTPAMIAHARQLRYTAETPSLVVHDVTAEALPHGAGSVDLVCMSSLLHLVDEPLPVLAEVRRVLAARGTFLLNDWIRQPLPAYLAWRRDVLGERDAEVSRRSFRLFPVHSKYTAEDWQWLLGRAGFALRAQAQLRPTHRTFVATPAG